VPCRLVYFLVDGVLVIQVVVADVLVFETDCFLPVLTMV